MLFTWMSLLPFSYAAKNAGPSCRNRQLEDEGRRKLMQLPLEKNSADLKEVVDKVIKNSRMSGTYQKYLEKAATLTGVEE